MGGAGTSESPSSGFNFCRHHSLVWPLGNLTILGLNALIHKMGVTCILHSTSVRFQVRSVPVWCVTHLALGSGSGGMLSPELTLKVTPSHQGWNPCEPQGRLLSSSFAGQCFALSSNAPCCGWWPGACCLRWQGPSGEARSHVLSAALLGISAPGFRSSTGQGHWCRVTAMSLPLHVK